MKDFLTVVTTTFNEAAILPWFLRYYGKFAERIIVFDDKSRDGTRDLPGKQEGVELRNWEGDNGIDEEQRLAWAYAVKRELVGKTHWVMIVDVDEFIFGPYRDPDVIREILADEERHGHDVVQTLGCNMCHPVSATDGVPDINAFPKDTQLWHLIPNGVLAPIYSKPVVVTPEAPVNWHRGRHQLDPCPVKLSLKPRLKLLHFRFLSPAYTKARNTRNFTRCGARTGDKGAAWSCDPARDSVNQEGTSLWTAKAQSLSFNIIETPI